MSTSRKVSVSDLDFAAIKHSLETYLEGQSHFSGFNFSGSGLSILLDLLAFNASNNAFMASMLGNEMFIDTAQIRDSVVSLAKQLGYTPRSMTAASAIIDLTIQPNSSDPSLTLSKYTQFNATVDGTSYTFYPSQAYTGTYDDDTNQLTWEDVTLKEGSWKTYRYIVDLENPDQQFIIPDNNVDTSTLVVRVQESLTDSTSNLYTLADDLTELDGTSKVFFLQESSDGLFEVYFGDGVLGKRPTNGQLIVLEYIITSGADANSAASFSLESTIEGDDTGTISVTSSAGGGAAAESIESIRFLAPKAYQAQGRSVTVNDYEATILQNFSSIRSAKVWGGENGDPRQTDNTPQYGKVFFSLIPESNYYITEGLKRDVIAYLRSKNLPTIIPEHISVEYIDILPNINISYDKDSAVVSDATLRSKAKLIVEDYSDTVLEIFGGTWRSSQVLRRIDDADTSVLGSTMDVVLRQSLSVQEEVETQYTVRFRNEIKHPFDGYQGALTSSQFTWTDTAGTVYTDAELDDRDGLVRIVRYDSTTKSVLSENIGTIDYTTGLIQFTLNITDVSSTFYLYVQPAKTDLYGGQNSVLRVPFNAATISISGE